MKTNRRILFIFLLLLPCFACSQTLVEKNNRLLMAAYQGQTDSVLSLLLDSADVNCRNEEGITPLMYAAEKGHLDIVKILLYNGADPKLDPNSGRTALMSAAIQNYPEIVYSLLIYGANINADDEDGITALTYACGYNLYDMADYLLQNFVNPNIKTHDSTSAVTCAAYFGNTEIVGLLLRNNANANTKNVNGANAVEFAIRNNDRAMLDTLAKYQTDIKVYINTKQKVNAVDYAKILNRRNVVVALRKLGYHGSFLPFYDKISVSYNACTFNFKDIFMGAGIGIFDSKYNSSFELGFNKRLAKKRILEPQPDGSFYQLWEKKQYLYASFEKLFDIKTQNIQRRQGVFIRLKGIYSWGSYEGSIQKPTDKLSFVPGIGYAYMSDNLFVKAAYEYANLDNYYGSKHWITISAGFFIPINKRKLYHKITWM